jgi:Icc protein
MSKYLIIQISDIHAGESGFRKDMVIKAIEEINNQKPNLVVITGDLTWNGVREQFLEAKNIIEGIKSPVIVTLGNHDSLNVGYLTFEELFGPRFSKYEDDKIFLFAVDSTQPDIDSGHIGREQMEIIDKTFSNVNENLIKIFAIHHHLVPVPRSGRERDVVVDAGDVLELMMHKGVSLILSGHRHIPWVWRVENMLLCYSGTSGSPRLRGSSSQNYNIIELENDQIAVKTKFINGDTRLRGCYKWGKRGII